VFYAFTFVLCNKDLLTYLLTYNNITASGSIFKYSEIPIEFHLITVSVFTLSHHLSLSQPFTPDLKPIYFTNLSRILDSN